MTTIISCMKHEKSCFNVSKCINFRPGPRIFKSNSFEFFNASTRDVLQQIKNLTHTHTHTHSQCTHAHSPKKQTEAMPRQLKMATYFQVRLPTSQSQSSLHKHTHACTTVPPLPPLTLTEITLASPHFKHKEIFSDKYVSQHTHPSQGSHILLSKHPSELAHFNYLGIGPLGGGSQVRLGSGAGYRH